jgi:hypothetical protein
LTNPFNKMRAQKAYGPREVNDTRHCKRPLR